MPDDKNRGVHVWSKAGDQFLNGLKAACRGPDHNDVPFFHNYTWDNLCTRQERYLYPEVDCPCRRRLIIQKLIIVSKMKKLIFVDDDPAIQDIVRIVFKDIYELTIFSDGESLMSNNFEKPDVFLLDKHISGLDGLDICRFLKSQTETGLIPVIIISASPDIARLAKLAGADDVIEKPFKLSELSSKIAQYMQ